MTNKNVAAALIFAGTAIATAKASIDEFKEGWKNESKRDKAVRYLAGAGAASAAILAILFGIVAYVGVYDD